MSDRGERFNTSGTNGRDCPICFRVGTLSGQRTGDKPQLTCNGCFTVFELTWGDGAGVRDMLTRVRAPQPRFTPHWELTSPRPVKR